MVERCNCDASCGENRYHDLGDVGCKYRGKEASYYYEDLTREIETLKAIVRAKDMELQHHVTNVQNQMKEMEKYRIILSRFIDMDDIDTMIDMLNKYPQAFH